MLSDARASSYKYFPLNKGGDFRRWYGNNEKVILFDSKSFEYLSNMGNHLPSRELYFKRGLTWSKITASMISIRYDDYGFIFSSVGMKGFPDNEYMFYVLAFLNSNVALKLIEILSPTFSFLTTDLEKLPFRYPPSGTLKQKIDRISEECILLSRQDWDSFETSWDSKTCPMLDVSFKGQDIEHSFLNWQSHCNGMVRRLMELEIENNGLFIEIYDLQDELTPDVPENQITLARVDLETGINRFISYGVGCMMGRYSLDQPGLVYAHSENIDFDLTKYQTFPADEDGIIPIMDVDWFPEDVTNRFSEFLKIAWPYETFEENLKFVADSLSPKGGEMPIDTIRRYLSTNFFKDHLQTYKRRPIYWLFSSGKERAFQCLVYLHRYNDGTLSRMRNEYVTPLFGKMNARIDFLKHDIEAASSASLRNKFQKQFDGLKKKLAELTAFDAELRHYADKRIELDLDDGVKVNYEKFGKLLAEVKAVTGE
jgi:hypothetical protein